MSTRIHTVDPVPDFVPLTIGGGHRAPICGAYFAKDEEMVFTVSRCGVLNVWLWEQLSEVDDDDDAAMPGWDSGSDSGSEGENFASVFSRRPMFG